MTGLQLYINVLTKLLLYKMLSSRRNELDKSVLDINHEGYIKQLSASTCRKARFLNPAKKHYSGRAD